MGRKRFHPLPGYGLRRLLIPRALILIFVIQISAQNRKVRVEDG
jgi:hypothetical protein